MTTPTVRPLDHMAALVEAYDQAVAEAAKWATAAEVLKKRIQAEMGDATEATVAGVAAFTWKHTGTFAHARFAKDHPDLAEKHTVMRPALDADALAAAHPDLYTAYRGRRFERK